MKHYPHMRVPPFGAATTVSEWSQTDRKASLVILTFPFALGLIAFLLAIITTALGSVPQGTPRFYMAAFSFSYLVIGLLYLPAYAISYGWFWWATRDDIADLGKRLLLMPLVAAVFVWFPAIFFRQVADAGLLQAVLLLIGISLIVGYLWIGIARLILYVWRKVKASW